MCRINAFVGHCLIIALDQLEDDQRGDLFQIWHATLEPFDTPPYGPPDESPEEGEGGSWSALQIVLAESDYVFFPQIINEELARLATLGTNANLPCGHAVHEHKDALTKWQKENFAT